MGKRKEIRKKRPCSDCGELHFFRPSIKGKVFCLHCGLKRFVKK